MKKILSLVIVFLAVLVSTNMYAQKQLKFGHIDSNELLSMMPERQAAEAQLKKYSEQLQTTLSDMQAELERKYEDYMMKADSLSDLIRQTKETEIREMQQRIEQFNQTAQQDLQQKEGELLQPIVQKAKDAISAVGEEGGYIYVFDVGPGVILYHNQDSEDILPLVKAKLGIQ